MGHIGYRPQSEYQFGSQHVQGTDEAGIRALLEDLEAIQQAGVFSVVLETVRSQVTGEITERSRVPTIGIGSGPHCDGQVLVTADMLGLFAEFKAKFVKRYAELGKTASSAFEEFIKDVRSGDFPDSEHSYNGN